MTTTTTTKTTTNMTHSSTRAQNMAAAPLIHQLQSPGPLLLKCDRPATVTLKITGIPTPKVHWFLGKRALEAAPGYGTQYDGETNHSLVISSVTVDLDEGLVVEAVNSQGRDRYSLPVKTYKCKKYSKLARIFFYS